MRDIRPTMKRLRCVRETYREGSQTGSILKNPPTSFPSAPWTESELSLLPISGPRTYFASGLRRALPQPFSTICLGGQRYETEAWPRRANKVQMSKICAPSGSFSWLAMKFPPSYVKGQQSWIDHVTKLFISILKLESQAIISPLIFLNWGIIYTQLKCSITVRV